MKFLCIAPPPNGPEYFEEGSTYDGCYVGTGMINLVSPPGSDREGRITTYGPKVRSCMVPDPEDDDVGD